MARETDLIYKFASAPTVTDDVNSNYQRGDDWLDISTGDTYTCLDNSAGAAVWKNVTNILMNSGKWNPTAVTLGDFTANGVSSFNAVGAGHLFTFDPNQDDELLLNIGLDRNGIPYDGSDISVEIHWQLFSAPAVGNTVLWELDYAFVADGEDNYAKNDGTITLLIDAGARTQRQQYSDSFPVISGSAGSETLQMTLRRNGTGAGSDTYGGDVDLYGLHFNVS